MSEKSSIKWLRALTCVYVEVDCSAKGTAKGEIYAYDVWRHDAFELAERLLQSGGLPVLPSREEWQLTDGGGLLRIRIAFDGRASGGLVAGLVYTTLHRSIKMGELNEFAGAATWSKVQCGLIHAADCGAFVGRTLHAHIGLLSATCRQARRQPSAR